MNLEKAFNEDFLFEYTLNLELSVKSCFINKKATFMHPNLQILCQQGVMFYKVRKLLHLYSKVLQSISPFILAKKGCAHVSQTKLA